MQEAGVNLVSLGIFAWSRLEPQRGQVRFRLARPDHGPAPRRWCLGRPRDRDRVAAALAVARASRDAAGAGRRRAAVARRAPALLSEQPGLPRWRRGASSSSCDALRRASGARDVARRATSTRCHVACVLLRRVGSGVPGVAEGSLRRHRWAEHGPGAPTSGRSATRPGTRCCRRGALRRGRTRASSWTSCASRPTSCSSATRSSTGS